MRGLRNNNPLNIRNGYSRWEGKSNQQTDPDFVCFINKAMGYRAAWKLLYSYMLRFRHAGKQFNLANIIARWAPPGENNTSAYVRSIVRLTNYKIGGQQNLPAPDTKEGRLVLTEIIAAMTCVENGITMDEVPRADIDKGWLLAFMQ